MKKIIKAKHLGFCRGAKEALDEVMKYPKAYILGDVVHNKQVMQLLAKKNKKVIHSVTGNEDRPIVITAHGATVQEFEKLNSLNLTIVDTTCKMVKTMYRIGVKLESEGYKICIFGDKDHVEIKGIVSRLKEPIIVDSLADLEVIDSDIKLGVISQSTFNFEKFSTMSELISNKFHQYKVVNTICGATRKRQAAAKELAGNVDLMVVIGGEESSNTKKLYIISSKYTKSVHIQEACQIRSHWLLDKNAIGIAAGASTPDWIIDDVYDRISELINRPC
jgi:4-hydroxy-3-methylbut-2-enyl diphosphate reductase